MHRGARQGTEVRAVALGVYRRQRQELRASQKRGSHSPHQPTVPHTYIQVK